MSFNPYPLYIPHPPGPHKCSRCGSPIKWALALCFGCGGMSRKGQLQRAAQIARRLPRPELVSG